MNFQYVKKERFVQKIQSLSEENASAKIILLLLKINVSPQNAPPMKFLKKTLVFAKKDSIG